MSRKRSDVLDLNVCGFVGADVFVDCFERVVCTNFLLRPGRTVRIYCGSGRLLACWGGCRYMCPRSTTAEDRVKLCRVTYLTPSQA